MKTLPTILAALVLVAPLLAEARPHRHRPAHRAGPRVHISISPWAAAYAPAARPGWVWVAGHYVGPRWYPGYWRPAVARVGWLWVPGYWAGTVYIDGYWREERRDGQVWVDGYYNDDNEWVPGYWAPAGSEDAAHDRRVEDGVEEPSGEIAVPEGPPPEPPSGTVHHDYD